MLRVIRRIFCRHELHFEDIKTMKIPRRNEFIIACPCRKCGIWFNYTFMIGG